MCLEAAACALGLIPIGVDPQELNRWAWRASVGRVADRWSGAPEVFEPMSAGHCLLHRGPDSPCRPSRVIEKRQRPDIPTGPQAERPGGIDRQPMGSRRPESRSNFLCAQPDGAGLSVALRPRVTGDVHPLQGRDGRAGGAGVVAAIIFALNMKLLGDIAGEYRRLQESRFIPAYAKSNACGVAPFSARCFRRSQPSLMSGGVSRIWLQMT